MSAKPRDDSDGVDDLLIRRTLEQCRTGIQAVIEGRKDEARQATSELLSALAQVVVPGRYRAINLVSGSLSSLFATVGSTDRVRFDIGVGVAGVGALSVRLRDWAVARQLALLPSGELDDQYGQPYLVPSARLRAAQAQILPANPDTSMIQVAEALVRDDVIFRPDLPAADVRILDSLCQFNAASCLAQCLAAGSRSCFPEFRRYRSQRTDGIFAAVVTDPTIRESLLGAASDERLADVLRAVVAMESNYFQRFDGWDGFGNRAVQQLLDRFPDTPAPR